MSRRMDGPPDEGRRLLEAVLAAPDDVAPRLVYSDWLQQHDDPRGEFIAVQCELDRLDSTAEGEHVRQLLERQSALLRKHRGDWLNDAFGKRARDCAFERGFVRGVRLRVADLVATGERMFDAEPVHRIELVDGDVDSLTRTPAARRVRALAFFGVALGERKVRTLLRATCFTALETLDLTSCRLAASGARVVAEAGVEARFPALRSLSLANNGLGDDAASALADAPLLTRLRELHLGMNQIGLAGAAALARSPHLADIEHLHMRANPLGREGLTALRPFGARLHADGHTHAR